MVGTASAVVAAVAVWLLWPAAEEPRPREYADVTACLLTDQRGLSDSEAAATWAGMQEASLATKGQVRYLQVAGAQTVDNAATFVGTLMLNRCAVIVGVGPLPREAIAQTAPNHPDQRFMVVGEGSGGANVSTVSAVPANDLRGLISNAIEFFLTAGN
ncbi:hypothetical protein [Luedemannella flava]|uniref:hypothetical protein n=1 Tax=Luedemannella flava TaxID=349316 RepID=UPI0031DFDC79